jgi:hypothetical protein
VPAGLSWRAKGLFVRAKGGDDRRYRLLACLWLLEHRPVPLEPRGNIERIKLKLDLAAMGLSEEYMKKDNDTALSQR